MTVSTRAGLSGTADDVPAHMWGPGWREAWWWLGLPIAVAVALFVVYSVAPDFYRERLLPEHYGLLEVSHWVLPFIGLVLCVRMLRMGPVRAWPLLWWAILLFGAACLFMAGEEESWGQHLLKWNTPEFWTEVNRQNETNLHNTSFVFNQLPRLLLEIGIVVAGIIVPLAQRYTGPFNDRLHAILTPPPAILPVALMSIALKLVTGMQKSTAATDLLARPSEANETFYAMFILFYLIILYRRVKRL